MPLAWNEREVIIYNNTNEVLVITENDKEDMRTVINASLADGWRLDPVLGGLLTTNLGTNVMYTIILVRDLPSP